MAGKKWIRRKRAASSALEFFDFNEEDIASAIAHRLDPYWEGDEKPVDFGLALRALGRLLRASLDGMLSADREHDAQLAEAGASQRQVDNAGEEVHADVVRVRRIFSGIYGLEDAKKKLALDGPTATLANVVALLRQGKHLVRRLRKLMRRKGSDRRINGCRINHGAMADGLTPGLGRLDRALKALQRVRSKLRAAKTASAAADKTFDADLRHCVGFAKALCLLGAQPELARRLTTAVRRQLTGKKR